CPLPAGVRLQATPAASDSGRLGRVRVPGDQWGHHQGNLHHGDDPAQRDQHLPTYPPGSTTPLRIESSSLSSPVVEGQTLDLNCVIASPAQATVTWYKRGGSLPAKHQVGDTGGGMSPRGVGGFDSWLCASPSSPGGPCKFCWPHASP
ncbi:Basement membrane-specific heparan sulfate proteoglycan core protein, partial [Charadrius vociferus]